jgi:hypothetical protein
MTRIFQSDADKDAAAVLRAVLLRIEAGETGAAIILDILDAVDAPMTIYAPLTSIDDATRLAGRLHQDGAELIATATRLRPIGCTSQHIARVVTTTALRVHLAKLERKQ